MERVDRANRVVQQCRAWAQKLTDLSRRNRLLFYRALKKGTLPLRVAPELVSELLAGGKVSLADLLPEDADPVEAFAKSREIARTAISNREERGLSTLFLAIDQVLWLFPDDEREAVTPLALLPVSVEHGGTSSNRASIAAAGNLIVNPVLAYSWEQTFAVTPPAEDGETDDAARLEAARQWARAQTPKVSGLKHQAALTLDNFSFQKMAMVEELTKETDAFTANDIIAALAGVTDALQPVPEEEVTFDELERRSPDDEFLVLDADSSQLRVTESVLRGRSGVIHGPPGTGKSQTIANLIASLAARGKRILFVAEKRAALDVVKNRLGEVGLGHLVLDLHGADVSRKAIAAQIGKSFEAVSTAQAPDVAETHIRFREARDELVMRVDALHRTRPHIGRSAFHALGELLRAAPPKTRFRGGTLQRLTPERARDLGRELGRGAAYASILLGSERSPWMKALEVEDDHLLAAFDELQRLETAAVDEEAQTLDVAQLWELRAPVTLDRLDWATKALRDAVAVCSIYRINLLEQDRSALLAALAPARKGTAAIAWAFLTSAAFRAARRRLRRGRTTPVSSRELVADLERLVAAEEAWSAHSSSPVQPGAEGALYIENVIARLGAHVDSIERVLPLGWREIPWPDMRALVEQLLADRQVAMKLPAGRKLRAALVSVGLETFLDELKHDAVPSQHWARAFERAWLASWLDQFMLREPVLQAVGRQQLDETVREFRETDRRRVDLSAARVRREHAQRAITVFNTFTAEHQLLKKEAGKKARHLAFRSLLAESSHALTALCPCVMASPLSVSQLLPARGDLFDVVIFDEASQVQPEDAAPALLRAPQVVVAGDPKQLPPTTFFASETEQDDTEDSLTGLESVLDALLTVFPSWKLAWHYRSRDERLIAYSNRVIYRDSLITFPGTNREEPVVFEKVPFEARDGQEDSSTEEVKLVVQRILEHARERPDVSLGVITMGIKHRDRLQHALDEALASESGLAAFFDLQKPERFFVKNLEQVQGDERDEIFLSVGYAKNADGRLPYRFGPIMASGGERRLNVATTRAKRKMRVFCSFGHLDLDPKRSSAEGFRYLRGFLEFAASGGRILDGEVPAPVELNPFEEDVRLGLESRGLQVVPQLGVSGYRIDFAVQHPEQPGRFVMAIECDGASYHSAPMTRDRDRLRQQQLQALGWKVYRIWSTDWFHHRSEELERVVSEVHRVLASDDGPLEPLRSRPASVAPPASATPAPRGVKPWVPSDPKIDSVPPQMIRSLIRWVEADGVLRTDEELITEVAKEMGFKRMGNRIRDTIASFVLEKH